MNLAICLTYRCRIPRVVAKALMRWWGWGEVNEVFEAIAAPKCSVSTPFNYTSSLFHVSLH